MKSGAPQMASWVRWPQGVWVHEVWSFSQGSGNNNMHIWRLKQHKYDIIRLVNATTLIYPQTLRLMHMHQWQKLPEMHKHFRLMCSTTLHIQSCSVFAYRSCWWQRHLRAMWYTTLPNARGQTQAQCLMETDKESCDAQSLTNVFKFFF